MVDRLVSKIAAGGLSAGVFLLWWPEHVPGEGLSQLVLRGLLWTMTFELLLLAFGPLEVTVHERLRRRTAQRRSRVRERFEAVPAPARTGGAVVLASMGLAFPVALLAGAPHELVRADEGPKVVKQVIVKRPVIRRQVVVRRVVGPAAADAAAAARVQTTPARPAMAQPEPRVVTRTVVRRVVREVPVTRAEEPAAPQTVTAPPAAEPADAAAPASAGAQP
jgi:hypothetical protein